MPRGRGYSKRPINSSKNIIQADGALVAVTTSTVPIAVAVDSPALSAVTAVSRGCSISSIYFEVTIFDNSGAVDNPTDVAVVKNPGNNLSFADISTMGDDDNKKWVFHQERGIPGQFAGVPMKMKFVLRIPRGKQRMGAGDVWNLVLRSKQTSQFCVLAIYKWYQ